MIHRERVRKMFLKFKKRLKLYGFTEEEIKDPNNNLWAFKTSSKPCSCPMCSGEKYSRKKKHKKKLDMY